MKKIIYLLVLPGLLALASCNPFSSNYAGLSSSEIKDQRGAETCEIPTRFGFPEKTKDDILADMYALGYHFAGESQWYGAPNQAGEDDAKDMARSLGACAYMWTVEYRYFPGTYSDPHLYYRGMFFVKNDPGPLGADIIEAPEAYQRQFDTHTGGLVRRVLNYGPAYNAHIFRGDVIMNVNGNPFKPSQATSLFEYGKEYDLEVYREGQVLRKRVYIDAK